MNLLGTNAQRIIIERYDWPRCARCEMPVQGFVAYDTGTDLIFQAECHGSTETVKFTNDDFNLAARDYFQLGQAFADLS